MRQLLYRLQQHYQHLVAGSLFFIALAFDFHHISQPSIWFDEAYSIEISRQPLPHLWSLIFGPEPNMEIYYLFLHFWLNITASIGLRATEIVVRAPSAIFSALSTMIIFILAKRFQGTFTAILSSMLYLLSNETLVYAQQVRSYALQVLLICIAWYALLAAITSDRQQKRWWIIYVITASLSVYAQLFSVFVLLSQGIAILGILTFPNAWRGQALRQWKAMLVSVGAIGVSLVPMFLVARQGSKTGWMSIPRLHDVYEAFRFFSGYQDQYLSMLFAFCGISLAIVYLAYIVDTLPFLKLSEDAKIYLRFVPIMWSLFCWAWIPLVISYIVSHGPTRVFSPRYLVVIIPPFFLLVAFGVACLKIRTLQLYFALLMLWAAWPGMHYYYGSAQVEDWRTPVAWLAQQYRSGDGLICYDNVQGCQVGVEYYLQADGSNATFTNDYPGAFSWAIDGPVSNEGYEEATDVNAIDVYAKKHKRLFYIAARLSGDKTADNVNRAEQWMDSHYHFQRQIVGVTVTIRLYQI